MNESQTVRVVAECRLTEKLSKTRDAFLSCAVRVAPRPGRGMGGPFPPPRGDYATLTDTDVAYFRRVLEGSGEDGEGSSGGDVAGDVKPSSISKVRVDAKSLAMANEDWMKKYKGKSKVLLMPSSTAEVSLVLKYCNTRKLAVVPQGGNTGLVGGGVPVHDEVILNLCNLNKIVKVDPSDGVLVAEAGVVLEDLEHAANAHGLCVPLDLGAKGRCQIGGNVSTNAGGLRLVKYGSLRGSVLGLEVVLADGRVRASGLSRELTQHS